MYKIDDLERDIANINQELAPIRADRGRRYGTAEDTLANIREAGGWRAAYVGAHECISRIKRYFEGKAMDKTDFGNASKDLINFAFYIKVMHDDETKTKTQKMSPM